MPSFRQSDERWGDDPLGGVEANGTLGGEGCAVAAAAMVFQSYGIAIDPQQLNWFLTAADGYTENDLQDLFEQHGTVNEVHLMMDRFTGKSRGFAFVTMNDGAQANAAMSALNGQELNGRPLTVNEARPREERPRPYGGGGGGKRSFAGNRR